MKPFPGVLRALICVVVWVRVSYSPVAAQHGGPPGSDGSGVGLLVWWWFENSRACLYYFFI
ncbi:hypothetical protein, partial [Bifidobacterium felsineum]|uniref:hypothetical protein n=1 Tax=Bifidobacterium felsineum TaxID=2045440 RepID=UPI001BDBEBAA